MMVPPTRFREYDSNLLILLAPDLCEWLPKNHTAYFILDVVGKLDLSSIYRSNDGLQGGQPPYDPRIMVGLLLLPYCEALQDRVSVFAMWPQAKIGHIMNPQNLLRYTADHPLRIPEIATRTNRE